MLLLWLAAVAHAASVAVLELDGYGVTAGDTSTVTDGLRDALTAETGLDVLTASSVAEGLTAPHQRDLDMARQRVAQARVLYKERRAEEALPLIEQAVDLHYRAQSDAVRRGEMADAWYLQGLCLIALMRDDEAQDAFFEALYLYPNYVADRAVGVPTAAIGPAAGAQAALEVGKKRIRSADSVADIAATLQVDYVVIGYVDAKGQVLARMYEGGSLVAEERDVLAEMPALPVDDAYGRLARGLYDEARGVAAPPARAPEVRTPTREEPERPAPVTKVEKPTRLPPEEPERPEPVARADKPREEPERPEKPEPVKPERTREEPERTREEPERPEPVARAEKPEKPEKAAPAPKAEKPERSARVDLDEEPERAAAPRGAHAENDRLTSKWWFWTAVVGGAGGVGSLVGYAVVQPPPVQVEGPPVWSVEVSH